MHRFRLDVGAAATARTVGLLAASLLAVAGCRSDPEVEAPDPALDPEWAFAYAAPVLGAEGGAELALGFHREVAYGYGCGGHCAYNWRGASDVRWTIGPKTYVIDEGWQERQSNYPSWVDVETVTWSYTWTGTTSIEVAGKRVVRLSLDGGACSKRRRVKKMAPDGIDDSNTTGPCEAPFRSLGLHCERTSVPLSDARKQPTGEVRDAWKCHRWRVSEMQYRDEDETPGPWVFGTAARVDLRYVGEPEPRLYFVAPPAAAP